MYVVYSVTDSVGRSQCSPAAVVVSLSVGGSSTTCALFSSSSAPYNSCSLTIGAGSFTPSGTSLPVSLSLAVNSVVVKSTSLGNVTLAAIPTQSNPLAVGLYFQMPIYVAVPGDLITVQMYSSL